MDMNAYVYTKYFVWKTKDKVYIVHQKCCS